MRAVFLIAYDGTDFSGWQKQKDVRTVQSALSEAAFKAFGEEVAFTASGRTDAGVHAQGQVAQAEIAADIPPEKLRECMNAVLPSDVKILKSAAAPVGFDCTRGAKKKTYRYTAYFSQSEQPLLSRYATKLLRKPDTNKMREAANLLIGEHDFAAFRAAGYTSKTSVRKIDSVEIKEKREETYFVYAIEVTGNGFLYNMVRILSGELFAVGCGKEQGIARAFETGERTALAKTMPPQGLTLIRVDYDTPLFGES